MSSFSEIVNQLYELCVLEKERNLCLNIKDKVVYSIKSDSGKTIVSVLYNDYNGFNLYFNIDLLSSYGYSFIDFDDKFSSVCMMVDFHNSSDSLINKFRNDLKNNDCVSYRLYDLLGVEFSKHVFDKIISKSSRIYHIFDDLCFGVYIVKNYALNDFYINLNRVKI